jgi:integrase
MAEIEKRIRKVILQNITDIEKAKNEIFKKDFSGVKFLDFFQKLIDDMGVIVSGLEKKKAVKAANKIKGNIRVYQNVKSQFEIFGTDLTFEEIDFVNLERFKNYQLGIGNSKATINLYLRTLRAVYNKGLLFHRLPDQKPFQGLFAGLKTRAHNSKKKYLDKDAVLQLESFVFTAAKQRTRDLWLLQFYFGGCDLIDIYYLYKKQIRRGRVVFERGKTNTGVQIDLKIHPKAQMILDKYQAIEGEWLFPWKKENESYITFRGNYQRDLKIIQELAQIEVLPDSGHLGIKVARHTFANLAKKLRIDVDVIRELMGHERDDVDNFYKDRYSEEIRDQALYKIISSFDCVE